MALVTVQRSPSPSTDLDSEGPDGEEGGSGRSPLRNRRSHKQNVQRLRKLFHSVRFLAKLRPCLSESYFTVRGAALILPQGDRPRKSSKKTHGGDIQHHLQSMLYLLKHEDKIKVAVRLESTNGEGHQRYMALVSTVGRQDTEESVILGIDYMNEMSTIGLVLPIYHGTQIRLDGDGGFCVKVSPDDRKYLFKPVSVQAMWSALQSLQKAVKVAEDETYIPNGLTHTWVQYYTSQIDNSQLDLFNQWNQMEGVEISLSNLVTTSSTTFEQLEIKHKITNLLTQVMMKVDLDLATSKSLREAVEEQLGKSIKGYREYFDSEMMRIFGQMDSPSQILDFLYLGTEWNASNLDELNGNGVKYILNVTREIDNFFPGQMKYMNVRVYDVDESQLLPHWEKTYRFISKAKKNGSKVLVHCKRGISRSASTVIAYLMKENKWSLVKAFEFVSERREIINPNDGFLEQLKTYEGILNASNQRHIFKSQSAENILERGSEDDDLPSDGVFLEGADLYRQMFDYHEAASEEEMLQSLGRGRGLEDDDMVRIGADLETGSRSTDSLEESLPDIPSPTPEQQELISRKKSSRRGEYSITTQYDNTIATSGEVTGIDMIRHEYASDVDDEASAACVRGGRSQNSSPVISISECGSRGPDGSLDIPHVSSQTRLRPDNSWIKLEDEVEQATAEAGVFEFPSASPPQFTLGDDVIVKSESKEFCRDVVDRQTSGQEHEVSSGDRSARIRSVSLGDTKQEDGVKTETDLTKLSIRNRTASLGNKKSKSKEPVPDDEEDVRAETTDIDIKGSIQVHRKAQLGIAQYYVSEQIPWCPGTVQKMKSGFSKIQTSSDDDSDSGQKDLKQIKSEIPELEKNVQEVTGPPAVGEDNSLRMTQSCIELCSHDVETNITYDLCQKRPKSVYEAEEIEFAEGFVKKFKNRLEGKSEDLCESRPIQRSASLKEERESLKAKRSERRKTCSPILSPAATISDQVEADQSLSVKDEPADQQTAESLCQGEITAEEDKNYTVIKYGSEEVPLEKGLVKKHKQDYESRTDIEIRKRLSSEGSVSSVTVDNHEQSCLTKEDDGRRSPVETVDPSSKQSATTSPPVESLSPSMTPCDSSDNSNTVLSERLIRTVKEQKSILESKEAPEVEPVPIRIQKKTKKEEKPVDAQTLAKMREFGSELLNQPRIEEEVEEKDLTLVKQVVRSIEKEKKAKKSERKIIIIEEGGKKDCKSKGQGQSQPLSEKSRSFDDSGAEGARRTRQWVRDGGTTSFESADLHDKDGQANRASLSLNLAELCLHEGQLMSGGSVSPSDSEPSLVRHLVGRFEKDIKSPISETADGTSSNRSSVTEFGLCFVDTRKKKEEGYTSDVEMRLKSSEGTISRPLRPKSADHIVKQHGRPQVPMEDPQPSNSASPKDSESSQATEDVRKVRRIQAQNKPVIQRLGASPFYNTM